MYVFMAGKPISIIPWEVYFLKLKLLGTHRHSRWFIFTVTQKISCPEQVPGQLIFDNTIITRLEVGLGRFLQIFSVPASIPQAVIS